MRKSSMLAVVTAAATVLLLAGCSSSAPSAAGTWGPQGVTGKPYLELKSDGHLAGSDGCNRLTGSWKQDGATVTFGAIASTMMYCQGVDTWLNQASSATVSDKTLTVENAKKKKIGTLTKQ